MTTPGEDRAQQWNSEISRDGIVRCMGLIDSVANRKPSSKASSPAQLIAEVGLRQLRSRTYNGVSLHSIANALGTDPASLCDYVRDRNELDQLMVEEAMSTVSLPPVDIASWRENVDLLLQSILAAYAANPGVAEAALSSAPALPSVLRFYEYLVEIFDGIKISPTRAAWTADFLLFYVSGVAFEIDAARDVTNSSAVVGHSAIESFCGTAEDSYPGLRRYAHYFGLGTPLDHQRFIVDLVLSGLTGSCG